MTHNYALELAGIPSTQARGRRVIQFAPSARLERRVPAAQRGR